MSTAQDLPAPYGEPAGAPGLHLVPDLDFEAAVRQVRPRLHRYAVRRLGDVHEAEELVQEALLRAFTHREQLRTEDDLSAWSTVVTGRLVIDRLRVRGRSTSVAEVPDGARVGRDTADIVVGRDEARTALDALDAMPARQAAVLWAREVEGLTYEELGARFQMTEPAVRSVLTRARKALRKEYALRGGTLPVAGLSVLAPWIAGLTWADRLRAAVGRVTAPATLATIGVTTLGGLLLSPFGFPDGQMFLRPSEVVVADASRLHQASVLPARPSSAPAKRSQPTGSGDAPLPVGPTSGHTVAAPLSNLNCEEREELPAAGGGVFGASCTPATGYELQFGPPLPDNPTGITRITVKQEFLPCSAIPDNPVVRCTPVPEGDHP